MSQQLTVLERVLREIRVKPCTLLGVSPVSEYAVKATIRAASKLKAPVVFVASLNQVDVDGGYTGFTPGTFVEYVKRVLREREGTVVLFQVDHCGPWLKDEHVAKNYSYSEALDATLKSVEAFIRAGFNLVHVDATIDKEVESGVASLETAVKRTVEIVDLAEDIAAKWGVEVKYEVGSDRWGHTPPNRFEEFISGVVAGLKKKSIDPSKVVFAVAEVGTRIKPGNRVNGELIKQFTSVVSKYGYLLKVHSGDYLENPEILPQSGVGGLNVGPMLADVQYRVVKRAILEIGEHELLSQLNSLILRGDKLGKYTGRNKVEEYEMGLASRYVWSSREAYRIIEKIEEHGLPVSGKILENVEQVIEKYMKALNLEGLSLRL